jgi:anti-sigma factor RsiW
MSSETCSAVDDYLAGDLFGDERARFVAHLSECADCRRAVHEQERIDALLRDAVAGLESAPAGLTVRVRHALRVARRRRAAVALTALAASVAAVGILSRPTPRPDDPTPVLVRSDADPPALRPAERARVRFPAGAGVTAVSVPTESSNVTFLWLFPERRPASRPVHPDNDPASLPEGSSR